MGDWVKWNQGNIIGHSLMIIKCNWMKFFPKRVSYPPLKLSTEEHVEISSFFPCFSSLSGRLEILEILKKCVCCYYNFKRNFLRMWSKVQRLLEAYLGPCWTSMMKFFAKTVRSLEWLTIFSKIFMEDVWQGRQYVYSS